ncbi:MAG TPA: amidohydrolase family protein [Chitinophagaceae bacterium]|nr:amidohydrolase family protein [Chitinophagaceae bacterium]
MRHALLLLLLITTLCSTAQDIPNSHDREIVFLSVNVIPMNKETILHNQTVVIKNGRVTSIGDAAKIKYNKNALVIDAKGKYLIPGLAEMHAHVPPIDNIEPMKDILLLFASRGVTTIRGMLGHARHLELRSKIQSGEILGPRFYTSGPSLNGNSVKSPAQAADSVRSQKNAGYDFMKLHPGLTKETFAAIVQTAKEVNLPFAGHVSYDVGVWRAIEAGYATIDHLDGFVESLVPGIENISEQDNGIFGIFSSEKADTSRIANLMRALREKNIWVVPTQALAERWFAPDKDPESFRNEPEMVYMSPNTINAWVNSKKNFMSHPKYNPPSVTRFIELRRKLIKACSQYGVGLLLGSDAPQVFDVPGFSIHHELRYMVEAGLTPYQALRMGTANVGRFYNNPDMGIIANGALADLVLLNGNPLTDIHQTNNIDGVMLNGKWLSKEWIATTLKKLEKK